MELECVLLVVDAHNYPDMQGAVPTDSHELSLGEALGDVGCSLRQHIRLGAAACSKSRWQLKGLCAQSTPFPPGAAIQPRGA